VSNQRFANNLKALCKQHPSVAFVCREMGINRQQFNKYLNGSILPSNHNFERICSFFNVDRETMYLDPREFDQSLGGVQNQQTNSRQDFDLNAVVDSMPNSVDALDRYQGYYSGYFHALGYPGYILRNLIRIYRHENRFYTSSIEHLWDKSTNVGSRDRFKYKGILMYLGDRMFLTEYETLRKQVVCHTIIYPSYRSSLDFLSGLTTGVGSLNAHAPKSTRIEFQFLGKNIDVKSAINRCGLFVSDSENIDDGIRERIANDISSNEFMLTARGE
jgi:transcriptional regulator with XRE-family HTH domain